MNKPQGIDKEGLPTEEGVYLAKGIWGNKEEREIDVYFDPIGRLSVYIEDYGGETEQGGIDDSTDCHVPVQNTGLEFTIKVRDFN